MIAAPAIGFIRTIAQVGIVVRDLDKALAGYAERLGIGPWRVSVYGPPRLTEMRLRGKPISYSMRVALAWTGEMNWELIEPLQGPSIYHEFLAERGEGLHHILVDCGDASLDEIVSGFSAQGWDPLMEGNFLGNRFIYFSTERELTTLIEVRKAPAGWARPEPDYWYPSRSESGERNHEGI